MKIIDNTKKIFKNSKLLKLSVISGAGAAVVDTFVTHPLIGLVELIGQGAGAFVISKLLKGDELMKDKSNSQITLHFIKSGGLMVGGIALHTISKFIPLNHITDQITSTMFAGGAIGTLEAGVEKFNRQNNTEVKKDSKNLEENSPQYHEMLARNFKATEAEVEASELSFSKSFKKN